VLVLAVLYDIHGNRPALEAVLADARSAEAGEFVLGGDYALFGPFPAEAVAMLEELPNAHLIRGNVDRWSAHPEQAPDDQLIRGAIDACREALGEATVLELDGLPEQLVLDGTLYCHASPVSDMRSFLPRPSPEDDELLSGIAQRRVVFGHTHLQFRRHRADGIELVNPGSVGMPLDGDLRAAYALVHDDGSIEQRRVDYDNEAASAATVERYGEVDWARRTADRLLHALA
jgi:predicted phosphodiesterase